MDFKTQESAQEREIALILVRMAERIEVEKTPTSTQESSSYVTKMKHRCSWTRKENETLWKAYLQWNNGSKSWKQSTGHTNRNSYIQKNFFSKTRTFKSVARHLKQLCRQNYGEIYNNVTNNEQSTQTVDKESNNSNLSIVIRLPNNKLKRNVDQLDAIDSCMETRVAQMMKDRAKRRRIREKIDVSHGSLEQQFQYINRLAARQAILTSK